MGRVAPPLKITAETELANPVVEWLQAQHWDVYQEVQTNRSGKVADIVAVQGKLVWVVECKLQFGVEVIEQAIWWKYHAHLVSVAVPKPLRGTYARPGYKRSWLLERLCRDYGVGILQVDKSIFRSYASYSLNEDVDAALNRKAETESLISCLVPEHKTFALAGNNEGLHWTPFQRTCKALAAYVKENPGCALKDAIENLDHHYSSNASARACIKNWTEAGLVRGVRIEKDGKRLRLFPSESVSVSEGVVVR